MTRTFAGTAAAFASTAALTAAMLPVRDHLSIATPALVLVIPVVVGVVAGGVVAGVLSVAAGFLVYDFFFIPPYETMAVGAAGNWAALAVYAVVMLPVSQVVAGMNAARAEARRQGREIRELFEISHLFLEDKPLDTLLSGVVTAVGQVFGAEQVALLLPKGDELQIVASSGPPMSRDQLRQVIPMEGQPATLEPRHVERGDLLGIALAASGRAVGLLVLSADPGVRHEREPLLLFANQIALAVERAQLRERAMQARVATEVAELANTLVSAVSHDLRTPLMSIKASLSALADHDFDSDPTTTRALAGLADVQADRLAELVANLLDMSRIQAGVLRPRLSVVSLADLAEDVTLAADFAGRGQTVDIEMPDPLPPVEVDVVLISRVLTNLLENAMRFNPKGTPIVVKAELAGDGDARVRVSVVDHGPGVNPELKADVFELFGRRRNDTGTGLGLTIAKTFVEAHGEHIWVEDAPGGGACFCLTLPVAAPVPEEEPSLVAHPRR